MGEDDGHVGEVDGHIIEMDGLRIFQPQAAPAPHARADARMARVEDGGQLIFGDDLIELVGHAVVWVETLTSRVKLEALHHASLDQRPGLPRAHHALVRVDGGEGDHDVRIVAGGVGDLFIGDAAVADLELRVHGEHHEPDLALAVIGQRLGDARTRGHLEIFARGLIEGRPEGIGLLTAGHFGVGVHVNSDEIIEFHAQLPVDERGDG